MSNKPFDPKRPVQTRAGGYARIVDTNFQSPCGNILAVVVESGREFVRTYYADGRYSNHSQDRPIDLVNKPEKIERWHNVYADGSTNSFKTREAADQQVVGFFSPRIACVLLSVTEGDGL